MAEKPGGVLSAHLQLSGSQDQGGASLLFVGLPAKGRVGPNRLCRGTRQLHVVHDGDLARIVDEQLQRLSDAATRFINTATLCVAAANAADGRDPPARFVPFVGNVIRPHDFFNQPFPRHGSKSRSLRRSSPGPMSSPASTGTVVTHRPHSSVDAGLVAGDLDATEGPENPTKVLRRHKSRITESYRICL